MASPSRKLLSTETNQGPPMRFADRHRDLSFVVIGAMKSGTTWIDEALRTGTNASLPERAKELFYFDEFYDRGHVWYERQFGAANGPIGEVASTYYASPKARERLSVDVHDEVRIIVCVRDPFDRAWSHYKHEIRKGTISPTTSFAVAARERPEIIGGSRYHELLAPWRDTFGERFHLLVFEELRKDPESFALALFSATGATRLDGAQLPAPTNKAREPRSQRLARAAAKTSWALHAAGLHRLVDIAKRAGIAHVVETTPHPAPQAERDSARKVSKELLERDTERFRKWAGPLPW